jgi:hypothetical protein
MSRCEASPTPPTAPEPKPEEWIAYAGLNAIGAAVLLHVAIGPRWPFAAAGGGRHDREPGRLARDLRHPQRAGLS